MIIKIHHVEKDGTISSLEGQFPYEKAKAVLEFLLTLPEKWEDLMAAIDDLTNAITAEEANITAVQTYLQTILAELAALQGGATAAQIQALTAKITTDAATLAGMVPAPAPATPAA